MDIEKYYRSLTAELEAVKDRVRTFIDDSHWLTDGEFKEGIIRSMLSQRLPDCVKIGRGFILTDSGPTTQIDILLYRSDFPVIFRDGELVLITPDAVLGVVEVKSRVTRTSLKDALKKLASISAKIGSVNTHICFGLFSYQVEGEPVFWFKDDLPDICSERSKIIHIINLGCSSFVKWWESSPDGGVEKYEKWHSYRVENMSAGYFLANLIDAVCKNAASTNSRWWFPANSKEQHMKDVIPWTQPT